MTAIIRLLATACTFMVVGTAGCMEWHSITMLSGIIRIAIFMVLTAKLHKYAEKLDRKKRKKIRANRSTSSVNSHKNVA